MICWSELLARVLLGDDLFPTRQPVHDSGHVRRGTPNAINSVRSFDRAGDRATSLVRWQRRTAVQFGSERRWDSALKRAEDGVCVRRMTQSPCVGRELSGEQPAIDDVQSDGASGMKAHAKQDRCIDFGGEAFAGASDNAARCPR